MSNYMQNEILLFLRSMIIGICLIFCYDVLVSFRKVFLHHRIIIECQDLLFWVSAGAAVFVHVYCYNQGEMRGYLFLGYFLGVLLYHVSLQKLVRRLLIKILSLPVYFVKKVINGLLFPIKRGKIFVYNFRKTVVFGGKHQYFQLKRGNWVEKIKTKGKEKQNSE